MPTGADGAGGVGDKGAATVDAAAAMGDELITAEPDKKPVPEKSGSGITDEVRLDAWDDVAKLRAAEGDDKVNFDEGADIQQHFSGIVATRTKEELRDVGSSGSGGNKSETMTIRDYERSRYSGPATDYDRVQQYDLPAKEFVQGDKSFKVVDVKETPLQGRATFNKDKGLIEYKSNVKENPDAFREDVKGLLEGTVPDWEEMAPEHQEKMYGYIMRDAKIPNKPTKAEAQAAINDIRKRFPESGGSDFSQWKLSGNDEIIYNLEEGPGGYDQSGRPVSGGLEDQSDIDNLKRRFAAMPDLDPDEVDEAVEFYKTYRQDKNAAERWNLTHYVESPAKLLEAKKEEEAAPSFDAEGNPRKAAKKQSDPKKFREDWKNNFSGDVGVADVPKKVERHKEEIETARADFLRDPRVGEILAADSQLEVADKAIARSEQRAAAAPGYAAATAKVADVQARQSAAATAIDSQVDAEIDPTLKSAVTDAESKLKADRETTKAKLTALPATSFGKDEKEQTARRAGAEKLLDRMQKAKSVEEFDHYKGIWDAAVKDQPDLKDAADLNAAFTAERTSLTAFGAADDALEAADTAARAEIMATTDGQALAALDAELATAKSERDAARTGLEERDVAALDAAARDEAKTKAELEKISAENDALQKSIAELKATRARLAADTDYDKKEAEYQDKVGAYNALLTAAEQGDPQGVNAAWERLTGKKFPKELTDKDVKTAGLQSQHTRNEAEKELIQDKANKAEAENNILEQQNEKKKKKIAGAAETAKAPNTVVLDPLQETAESSKAIFEAGTGVVDAWQTTAKARQSAEQEGIREGLSTYQKAILEGVTSRRGELQKSGSMENLWKLGHPEKGEQTANQKAASDRAYSPESRKQALENRTAGMSLADDTALKEAEVEKTEAEREKLAAEAMAKWYKENPKYG